MVGRAPRLPMTLKLARRKLKPNDDPMHQRTTNMCRRIWACGYTLHSGTYDLNWKKAGTKSRQVVNFIDEKLVIFQISMIFIANFNAIRLFILRYTKYYVAQGNNTTRCTILMTTMSNFSPITTRVLKRSSRDPLQFKTT